MNLKKNIFRVFAIVYDIVALFWCYILASNLIYNLTYVIVGNDSIGIIGGVDYLTTVFVYGKILRWILPIVFIILSIFSVILLTITAFKIRVKKRMNIWLICLLGGALTLFLLFPKMTYIITLYSYIALRIEVLNIVANILYCLVTIGVIGFNVFSLIKRKDDIK